MRKVKVSAVQMKCTTDVWENIENAEKFVRQAKEDGANIVLLPELFERQYFCQERRYDYYNFAKPTLENDAVKHFAKLAKELENVEVKDMQIPVITNVTADYVSSKEDIKPLLIKQVSSSVKWEETIRRMIADGVDTFVEVGPGKALSGFIKKVSRDVKVFNVEDMASLEKTLEGLNA